MYYTQNYRTSPYTGGGITAVESPGTQAAWREKLFVFPARRMRHLLLIAALCTVISMVIINLFVSSIADSYLADRIAYLRPYASNQYTSFRRCNHCSVFNLSYTITNQDFCSTTEDIYLLILNIKVLFLLGLNEPEKSLHAGVPNRPYVSVQVNSELNHFNDIVVVNMADHYRWLTNKTLAGLSWVASYCSWAHYVLKTDDDCFNNPGRYVNFLTVTWLPEEFIGGGCFTGLPNRNKKSRWYTGMNQYPDMYFPVYCGGPAYLMPTLAVQSLLMAAQNVPYFTMEDIYVTGFCREAANIPYVQIAGANAPKEELENCDFALWVTHVHGVKPAEMAPLWAAAQDKESCYSPNTGWATVVCLVIFIAFWAYILSRILGPANKILIL